MDGGASLFDIDEDESSAPEQPFAHNHQDEDEFSDGDDFELLTAIQEQEKEGKGGSKMTEAEKARAERNRLKAISLKKSRLRSHPFSKDDKKMPSRQARVVDSGGGFFIEEEEEEKQKEPITIIDTPGPFLPHEQPDCLMCHKQFSDSFLLRTFDHVVCDNCRDTGRDGEHELITKTEAKSTFLLKDFDFERTEHGPALKFINRKNPHNPRGGEMKLFLRLQVEERAVEVWGSEEALQKELELREEKKMEAKAKKYNRQIKALRMAARSSLYKKDLSAHVHQYTDEIYHEDKDEYSQTCSTCGHINVYEKM